MTDRVVDAEGERRAQRELWAKGDYPAVARHLRPISAETLDLVGVSPGDLLLDVGVGDGNTVLEATIRGAAVTGIDLSPDQLAKARTRLAAEGLDVELHLAGRADEARTRLADQGPAVRLHEADAQDLPFGDGQFDVVVSVLGVIFAPDHARATAEMARACRPGGKVAVTAWQDTGWFRAWRDRAARIVPPRPSASGPAAGPRPDLWGHTGELADRLAAAGIEATVHERPFHWSFPSSQAAAGFFLRTAGGFIAFHEAAVAAGKGDEVVPALVAALDEVNEATDGTCRVPSSYLVGVGRRVR